jgi:ATP-binding cassette subfamily B protein
LSESALFFTSFTNLLALPETLSINKTTRSVPSLETAIEFRGVSFRYGDELPWVLQNICLIIPAKQCTALVGLNGEGKTTLVKLLMRFYDPIEGQITWDGVDIREFDVSSLRSHIGAIFQDFAHYDLTAHENIGFGNIQHIDDPERIALAAAQVGIDETIKALPQGYQTILSRWLADIGEGTELSGGEWQRVALARMFMRNADVLVLDEPSAALDAQAEHDIYQALVELVRGRTSLLISHRLNTVRMANQVAVIENGHIIESGSHDELFLQGGTYANLYNLQAERYR